MEGDEVLTAQGLVIHDSLGNVLVDRVDVRATAGRCLGIVGESGSGKTLTVRACLGMLPDGLSWAAQRLELCGKPIASLRPRELARLLGTSVGFVPQNTMEYLHPLMRVRSQIVDGYLTHHAGVTRAAARERACDLLSSLGVREPDRVMASYPGELSGGLRQRVNIAMALMGDPVLVMCDEPTAALDVVTQGQVAQLLVRACHEQGVAMVMVSHSLALVRSCCDDLMVMHAGHVVEWGPAREVCDRPGHPYTSALIQAMPRVGMPRDQRLPEIAGSMPSSGRGVVACHFQDRCAIRDARCEGKPPVRRRVGPQGTHVVVCAHAWPQADNPGSGESARDAAAEPGGDLAPAADAATGDETPPCGQAPQADARPHPAPDEEVRP